MTITSSGSDPGTDAALAGLKVLDLSRQYPGPFCTMLLADLGADVVVVEHPQDGDRIRDVEPKDRGIGAPYLYLGRGKRSVALDLKQAPGRAAFLRLAAGADVVVEGFRPGVADRLGVGYADLRQQNPGLVYCSISGYGQGGPHAQEPGHDINYQARSGALGLSGPRGAAPGLPGLQVADLAAGGLMAAVAILAALRHRDRAGSGQYIDIAMMAGTLALLGVHVARLMAVAGDRAGPAAVGGGWSGPDIGPGDMPLNGRYPCYQIYPAQDGHLALGALEPHFWAALCRGIDRVDLLPLQYATGDQGDRVQAELAQIFARRTRAEWERDLGASACLTPVQSLGEAVSAKTALGQDNLVAVPHPCGGATLQVRNPLRLSATPPQVGRAAPRLGEHTRDVLAAAGYSPAEIEDLIQSGAAGHS